MVTMSFRLAVLLLLHCAHGSLTELSSSHQSCPNVFSQHPPSDPGTSRTQVRADTPSPSSIRIAGGHVANSELTQYIAAVIYPTRNCTGVLLAPNIVLTGGHECITNEEVSFVVVGYGELKNTLSIPYEDRYGVKDRIPHLKFATNYDDIYPYSVQYFLLDRDVPNARTMAVNRNKKIPKEGSVVRALGYGQFGDANQINTKNGLHQVDIPVTSKEECDEAYKKVNLELPKHFFCYSYSKNPQCRNWYVSQVCVCVWSYIFFPFSIQPLLWI